MQIRTNVFSQAVEKKDLEVCKFKYKNNVSLEEELTGYIGNSESGPL